MQALREYMQVADLNQRELAKRIGISESQLNHWLNGLRIPTVRNLKLIANRTGISLERLAKDL